MLLTPTDFPTHPALREVGRALLYMAGPPPLSDVVQVRVSGGKVVQVLVPEREMGPGAVLVPGAAPLSAAQWAVVHYLEQFLVPHAKARHNGRWLIRVEAGVPLPVLHWKPEFVVQYARE